MDFKKFLLVFIALISLGLMSFKMSKSIQKKLDKEIKEVFQVETFRLDTITITDVTNVDLPLRIGEANLFKIISNENLLGYAYLGKAPSKTAEFDYLVLFDANRVINKTKVLVYREEYGGEIGSKRWLKQFLGKNENDKLSYGQNIDAISGATISVRSMTHSMNRLLQTIAILHKNNIL